MNVVDSSGWLEYFCRKIPAYQNQKIVKGNKF